MCDTVTLKRIISAYNERFHGCELYYKTRDFMSQLYVSWRKIVLSIQLSPRAHNYIVSNLGNCIMYCRTFRS